jgi:hypothetical protein
MSTHTTQLPFSAKSTNYSTLPAKRPSAREREYLRPKEADFSFFIKSHQSIY